MFLSPQRADGEIKAACEQAFHQSFLVTIIRIIILCALRISLPTVPVLMVTGLVMFGGGGGGG